MSPVVVRIITSSIQNIHTRFNMRAPRILFGGIFACLVATRPALHGMIAQAPALPPPTWHGASLNSTSLDSALTWSNTCLSVLEERVQMYHLLVQRYTPLKSNGTYRPSISYRLQLFDNASNILRDSDPKGLTSESPPLIQGCSFSSSQSRCVWGFRIAGHPIVSAVETESENMTLSFGGWNGGPVVFGSTDARADKLPRCWFDDSKKWQYRGGYRVSPRGPVRYSWGDVNGFEESFAHCLW
ncbi:hypothetical protein BU23DRAFT_243813 [Bimuria novae-zelandiae CBS 107.79]|uniref:Uncharacterized protein n=1 Tax=Bimuria novae-zelandiae CBS 107.79 TaxID=1447943 RepID=A0A6A5V2A0_9PLEO|nr:hypothetical protein BU23DRAFT_243813 [Bimuria novae-zelandiae CBS 107.79]